MKGILRISLFDKDQKEKYSIETANNLYDCNFEFSIITDINEDFNCVINDKSKIENDLKKQMEDYKDDEIFHEDINLIKMYLENKISLEQNVEYITIDFSENNKEIFEKVKLYINKNKKYFKNKKIIIEGINDIEMNQLSITNNYFKEIDNIYFKISGNDFLINYNQYIQTCNKFNEIIDNVKKLNMSPIENLMYLYDYFRNKEYQPESENDNYGESRDLTKVLLGSKIVCAGFTELFDKAAKKLNFKTYQYLLQGKENNAHIRNLIYVEDQKYSIDGLYFFDLTWDCKKNGNEFLNKYKYFLKTKPEMDKYDKNRYYENKILSISEENIEKIKNENDIMNIIDIYNIDKELIKSISEISKLLYGKNIISVVDKMVFNGILKNDLLTLLEDYKTKMNQPIDIEKFFEILCNVRKIQHNQNPEFYPYDYESIGTVLLNSDFNITPTEEEKLFAEIFDQKIEIDDKFKISRIRKILNNSELKNDIKIYKHKK